MQQKIVNLDKIDRKLLFELDSNCRQSDTQLAKKIGRSREATRYRIQQLMKQGVLEKFITSINHAKLGITYYKLYLQLENIPEEREKLFSYAHNHHSVPWYGVCSGVWDAIIGISAHSHREFDELKNEFCSLFKHLIIRKQIGVMVETKQYLKKYLTGKTGDVRSFAGDIAQIPHDGIDQKILDNLANNARIPLAALARQVGVGISSVQTRMRRLEETGVIITYRTSIDSTRLGYEFFKVILYYRSISKTEERRMLEYVQSLPQSIYYITMIAPWDAEIEFIVKNYHELIGIIDRLRKEFPHTIRNYETVVIHAENWLPGVTTK